MARKPIPIHPEKAPPSAKLLTVNQTAPLLQMSAMDLYRKSKDPEYRDRLGAVRIGGALRFRRTAIEKLVGARVEATP